MNNYAYTKEVDWTFQEAIEKVTFTLQEEGFGILTTINVTEKMKQKLWKDMDDYIILWACNPALEYEAIGIEIEIWLLLPCNVIVYRKNQKTFVSAIVPSVAMWFIGNESIENIAWSAEIKLKKAIDNM